MVKPEKARQLIEMLRPAQLAGEQFPCPRCERPTMKTDRAAVTNALSRYASVYICDECGMDEALRDMAGTPLPLAEWAMVRSFTEHRR